MNMLQSRSTRMGSVCWRCCLVFLLPPVAAHAQEYRTVTCQVEGYAEYSPGNKVVVLQDPSGEQQARFDLTNGATLVSLRYHGRELLFGRRLRGNGSTIGVDVSMYRVRHGTEAALKGQDPFTSAFLPTQGLATMDMPATVAGVACDGRKTMDAFAMMVDFGADQSFERHPLLAVWKGRLSGHFPPGYSTPYTIETEASWVRNPGKMPQYYLRLEQTVVNIRAEDSGPLHWLLLGAVPWNVSYATAYPGNCTVRTPCQSHTTPVVAAGRYADAEDSDGVAVVIPTKSWTTNGVYVIADGDPWEVGIGAPEVFKLRYLGAVLTQPLPGSTAFDFQWYICAGAWSGVRGFVKTLGH